MRRLSFVILSLSSLLPGTSPATGQGVETVSATLRDNQYDLAADGQTFLVKEAANASFFMLGELHGDSETAALVRAIWPAMWQAGYRHIAAEVSPWAAQQLAVATERPAESIRKSGSWSRSDVAAVAARGDGKRAVLWGCDMEELRPHVLIRELAAANPNNQELQSAAALVKVNYARSAAPKLLEHLRSANEIKDLVIGGVSLRGSIMRTLEIEVDRMSANTRLQASNRREALMKDLFHRYWQQNAKPKVMLRFGRNHLHRGLDRRGVSTLGNFVAELAAVEGVKAFNVAEFSGGGTISWGPAGLLANFDERNDDPAFAFLGSIARHAASVFDLRPIRQALHQIPQNQRSPIESSLVYWADSYDAIIFYRQVTPLER